MRHWQKNIISFRNEHGRFTTREQLKQIPRMGEKTFQQAAGFLRIVGGDEPLDASGVHPETYPLVEKILSDHQLNVADVLGHPESITKINPSNYVDNHLVYLR